jgi:transcriptional regulator with AAA-type ATPase domain
VSEVTTQTNVALSDETGGAPAPYFFLVFQADRPTLAPARFPLHGIGAIDIGRGTDRAFDVVRDADVARMVIKVADPLMSGCHARLTHTAEGWVLEDVGSRNGTFVNGVATRRAVLADGDLVELGQTLLVFRIVEKADPHDVPLLGLGVNAGDAMAALTTVLPSLAATYARVIAIARSRVTVMIRGETGSGKELMARAIHALSGRPGELVAVNCGALAPTLVESELFGHKKGAFSGAIDDRPGLVRAAERGTLLLDEIGDLPPPAQAAFLRVLQEREVLPVGSTRPVVVDFRLISATHRPLDELVTNGTFRADLYTRIAGHHVELPPLRERREDLGLLVAGILRRLIGTAAESVRFTVGVARALFRHPWRGNIRELEKCLEACLAVTKDGPIGLEHLPDWVRNSPPMVPMERSGKSRAVADARTIQDELHAVERQRLIDALEHTGWNKKQAAALIGMPLRTFHARCKLLGLRRL